MATLVPAIVIGFRRWPLLTKTFRPLLWCCVMWLFFMLLAVYTVWRWNYNVIIWNIVTVFEGLLLSASFCYVLEKPWLSRWWPRMAALYVILAVAETLLFDGINKILTVTVVVETCGLVGLAMSYFDQTLQQLRRVHLEHDPMFLVSVGIVCYFSGTIIFFVLTDHLPLTANFALSIFNHILSVLLNLCIARALWLAAQEQAAQTQTPLVAQAA